MIQTWSNRLTFTGGPDDVLRLVSRGRCLWCGGKPRFSSEVAYFEGSIIIKARCHHRLRAVAISQECFLYGVPDTLLRMVANPFPLPKVPARLNPVRPRGFVVQADGTRAWLACT